MAPQVGAPVTSATATREPERSAGGGSPDPSVILGERTLTDLVERAPFGIYVVDADFRIAHMNAGSRENAFRNVRPTIGRDLGEVMHILWPPAVAEEIVAEFRRTLATGAPYYSRDFVNARADEDVVEGYEWELQRLVMPDGTYAVVCYYFDSTPLRQVERSLRESEAALRAALAVKDEFLGYVSHELRTPMSVILGMSEVLARGRVSPAEERDIALDIAASAKVLNGLLENMLLLARLDDAEAERAREPVMLDRAVADVVQRYARLHPGRRYVLEIHERQTLTEINAGWAERVVENLLSNATKYGDPESPIHVLISGTASEVRCLVLDRGRALTSAELARVFEPFYRAPEAQAHAPGAGLGLAVCRQIIELCGGRIWGRPRDGGGAEFGFALPRLEPADG